MATVDELLNSTTESQVCTIDSDTRVITVPACYKEFGVEADEKVNRIKFQCPKIVGDNIDLTTFNLYINYMNASGQYNAYLVDDVTVSGDDITFSWVLSRHVTEKSGTVNYIVCAKKSDDTGVINEWNTKVATGTVGVGLEATVEVEEQNADVIEQILVRITDVESTQPDWNQNDSTASDYIKNRPCHEDEISNDDDVVIDVLTCESGHFQKIGTWKYYYNIQDEMDTYLGYSSTLGQTPKANYWVQPCAVSTTLINGTERTNRMITRTWDNSLVKALDEVNWFIRFGMYKIYFIVNRNKLSDENKIKFSSAGIFFEANDPLSIPSNIFLKYEVYVRHFYDTCIPSTLIPRDIFQWQKIFDSNNYFTTKTVEGALDQLGSQVQSNSIIIGSSTTDSTKKFKITVDDSGTLTATEVTE